MIYYNRPNGVARHSWFWKTKMEKEHMKSNTSFRTFPGATVARMKIPARKAVSDRLADVFAEVWNEAASKETAFDYIDAMLDKRVDILEERLYAYQEWERRRLTSLLVEFADAVYRLAAPFM